MFRICSLIQGFNIVEKCGGGRSSSIFAVSNLVDVGRGKDCLGKSRLKAIGERKEKCSLAQTRRLSCVVNSVREK